MSRARPRLASHNSRTSGMTDLMAKCFRLTPFLFVLPVCRAGEPRLGSVLVSCVRPLSARIVCIDNPRSGGDHHSTISDYNPKRNPCRARFANIGCDSLTQPEYAYSSLESLKHEVVGGLVKGKISRVGNAQRWAIVGTAV